MMPVAASTMAPGVDRLFWMLVGLSLAIMLLVGGLVLGFAIRYRRGSPAKRGELPAWMSREVEIGWTAATLFVALFFFWWASAAEIGQFSIPDKAMEIHVVARQWMWKTEHADGTREIDALHVPVGVPVKLVMVSQDVIHSFFVPAFRVKQDVLPGRYVQTWFEADKAGTFHLFCAEYCGTDHSRMIGEVVAMQPDAFAKWSAAQPLGTTLAGQGRRLFVSMGCSGCHDGGARVRAPPLVGLYGKPQPIAGGGTAFADEAWLRDAILHPERQVAAGYKAEMPSYEGRASEPQVVALIAYLKTRLSDAGGAR